MDLDKLKCMYPWPNKCPNVPLALDKGWFCGQNMASLLRNITQRDPCIVLEIGSWLGMSTRFLCEKSKSDATVIALDHWLGSQEHHVVPEWKECLPTLYETFLANCWQHRRKLVPVRRTSAEGISLLAELEIYPQLIYLDAAHDAISVAEDLTNCVENFPDAVVVGDDWSWDSVREGVMQVLKKYRTYNLRTFETCYEVSKC